MFLIQFKAYKRVREQTKEIKLPPSRRLWKVAREILQEKYLKTLLTSICALFLFFFILGFTLPGCADRPWSISSASLSDAKGRTYHFRIRPPLPPEKDKTNRIIRKLEIAIKRIRLNKGGFIFFPFC